MSERPIILGIVGDSAAGKTTLTKGVAQVLGEENVTVICTDDYHHYDRRQRAELGITPLPRLQLHGYHAAAHIPITGRTTDPQTGLRSQNWYF